MAGNPYLAPNDTNGVPTVTLPVQASAGAGDAGKIPALNAAGNIDATMLPPGIGPGVYNVPTSENLAAGDFVNLYSNAGVLTARKADPTAASAAKKAWGHVESASVSPAATNVYPLGEDNLALTGLTVGEQWLSVTTPGKTQTTPPVATGQLVQSVGIAKSATELVTLAGPTYVR